MSSGPYQWLEADSWNCVTQNNVNTNSWPGYHVQGCGDPSVGAQQLFYNNSTGVISTGDAGYLRDDRDNGNHNAGNTQDPSSYPPRSYKIVSTVNPSLTGTAAIAYGPFNVSWQDGSYFLDRQADGNLTWNNPNNSLSQVWIDRALQSVCSNIVGGINPPNCTQDAICKAMLPRGDISRTPQCAQWAMNNKSPETDGLVQAYCNATSNKADPLCGCYNAPASFTALQEQLSKQGVGLTLTCNSAACRNGNAYIPSQATSIPCPSLQVCIQDVSVGSANTANLSNVNLSCKQENKVKTEVNTSTSNTTNNTTTNNTTTPAPTPAGSSLTGGGSSSSGNNNSGSSSTSTSNYVEIGILIFGAILFIVIIVFALRSLSKST